jgi:DNA-binding YbaB/EbfC family protein
MARPRGPGGLDVNALLKQAQQMQAEMSKAQEELAQEEVDASAGGGMVKVTMSGDLRLKSIQIDPEAADPEDVEMLADMVMAAVNEAIRSARELATSKMGDVAGGLGGLGMGGPGGGSVPGL